MYQYVSGDFKLAPIQKFQNELWRSRFSRIIRKFRRFFGRNAVLSNNWNQNLCTFFYESGSIHQHCWLHLFTKNISFIHEIKHVGYGPYLKKIFFIFRHNSNMKAFRFFSPLIVLRQLCDSKVIFFYENII